jgi:hypothetical protein
MPKMACLKVFSYFLSFMRPAPYLLVSVVLFCLFTACVSRKTAILPSEAVRKDPSAFPRTDTFLARLLDRYPDYFDTLVRNKDRWQIQIIYTRIDRKEDNQPVFTDFYYNVNPGLYFYPASTVKLPAAILALQKLNQLHISRDATMVTGSAYAGQSPVYNDPETADGRPTVANYIRKIFLVSDNDAFNRLYEFLGQQYLNNQMHHLGFDSSLILHRLNISLPEDQNRHTNPISFYDTSGKLIYSQPMAFSNISYPTRNIRLGEGYYSGDKLVKAPFDFSKKNRIPLTDLHSMLGTVIFPEAMSANRRFELTDDDYRFLYRQMCMLPRESDFPQYDTSYPDAYVKFLLFGGKGSISQPGIRVFNKPGDAYGFLTDVAYFADLDHKVEFLLSATILCNSDGIFNDDHYDYDTVGKPFMKHLGEVIYDYELHRERKNQPSLGKFDFRK